MTKGPQALTAKPVTAITKFEGGHIFSTLHNIKKSEGDHIFSGIRNIKN